MNQPVNSRSVRQMRVVLSSLVTIPPIWATAAQPLAELGVAAFVVSGLTYSIAGVWAPWVVLAACVLGAAVRAADIEAWALLIPGGSVGCARAAFGERIARVAAAALLAERLLFAAFAALIIGSYAANAPMATAAVAPLTKHLATLDVSTLLAVFLVGFFWLRSRSGFSLTRQTRVNLTWLGCAILLAVGIWEY